MPRFLTSFCSLLFLLHGNLVSAVELQQRWLYLQTNLQVTENVGKTEELLRRAAKAGYNGVVLADYKLQILDRVPEHYFGNARRFKEIADELKLEVIPAVCPFGYSEGYLAHDPNLAEGLPARNVLLRVRGGQAKVESDFKSALPGDFELHLGDQFAGWDFQDEPGSGTFVDASTKHDGRTALRVENPPGKSGNRRVSKLISVRPWSQYHASVWIKTNSFSPAGDVRLFAMSPAGRVLSYNHLGVKATQDWTLHHVVFNSLESDKVRLYVGAWGAGQGKLWFDELRFEEAPFVNLVRRAGCPLTVTDEQGQPLAEGKDFAELRDIDMAQKPWVGSFDVYHEPPVLTVLKGGRVKEGALLKASFYHAVTVYDNQVPCSLTEPKVFELVEDQVRRVNELFAPRTWFLSHDEIRVANWSEEEQKSGRTAGQTLAENFRQCVAIVRTARPGAKIAVWSDMFDPHHNAVKDYYLVNGDLTGSWEGLPNDTLIVNWNSGKAQSSAKFFADRGHTQVLAGYYDAPVGRIADWLKATAGQKVTGVMYTTWQNRFGDVESFAKLGWQAGR